MLHRFYAVTGVVEPISASRRHFRRQSTIPGAEIDVVARSVTHSAIVASADGERESNQFCRHFVLSTVYGGGENKRSGSISYNYNVFSCRKRRSLTEVINFAHCFSGDVDKEEK